MLNLQERLVILVLAAILPLAALSVWFTVREVRQSAHAAQGQLKFAASLVAATQDRTIDAAEHLLGAIAGLEQLNGLQRENCARYFESLRGRYPVYANIGILDLDGNVRCHAVGDAVRFNANDRKYFREAVAEKRFVMGEPVMGRGSGRNVVPFSRPILDGDRVVAVAFAALDLQRSATGLAGVELPATARVVVADWRGRVLMAHPSGGVDAPPTIRTEIVGAAAQSPTGSGDLEDSSGLQRLYGYATSRSVGGERFIAVVSINPSEVAGASFQSLRDELIAFFTMLLLGLTAAWWIGGRVIVKPAKQIVGAVRRLEQGHLEARVPLHGTSHGGEFARIGAAFNLMAESLQLRQLDLETELGRSRNAYNVLEQVLDNMREALVAIDAHGGLLMHNEAARRLFPLEGPVAIPAHRPRAWGLFHADRETQYELQELPLARALRGESGTLQLMFVRNAQVPEGRMLQCSFQPIRNDGRITAALGVFTDITELERLQAERIAHFEELERTQARLIEAQRIGRIGNWELDLRTGRLWWSAEVHELFGVDPGFQPALAEFEQRVHPQDRHLLKPARDAALRDGQVMELEYRVVRPDGAIAWMYEIGEARRDEAGEPVWFGGMVQDITARKRNEEALRDSERELHDYTQMLQRAAEAAQAITALPTMNETMQAVADQARRVIPSHMAVVSLTQGNDWSQVVTSVSLSDKYGRWRTYDATPDGTGIYTVVFETGKPLRLTQEELLAHPAWRGFGAHAGEHPPIRGLLAVPLTGRSGESLGLLQLSDKAQGEFTERDQYVAVELAQLASIAIENARLFTEISELNAGLEARIAERTAELTRQELLYRTLAEQAPEIVWNTDAQGSATFLNKAWYDLVGGTPGDWLGMGWLSRIHPEDREDVQRNWHLSSATLQPYRGTRRILASNGAFHTMSYKAAPVLDERGEVVFWVGVDSDITGQKAIERALRTSNQELEAFSYSVSHDLRAPLGAIAGFSKALANKLADNADERSRHYMARIEAGVKKMEQLIEALLSLSRVARAELVWGEVDLAALARDAVDELRVQQPDRTVEVEIQSGLTAHGDSRMMRVLMQNLVGNAWKFSAQRGEARVEVGVLEEGRVFFVRDNGVGFDMAYADKLFVAFQRLHTEAEFPGTGIGLATVRRIVARHQGRVWARSREGQGTTFYFTLSDAPPPGLLGPDSEK